MIIIFIKIIIMIFMIIMIMMMVIKLYMKLRVIVMKKMIQMKKNHLDNDLDANVAMVMMNLVNFKMGTFHNLEYDDDDDD